MLRTITLTALAVAAFSVPAAAGSIQTDEARMIEAFAAALGGNDDALAPHLTEAAVYMPSTGGRFEGAESIAQSLAAFPDVTDFTAEIDERVPLGEGHMLYIGTYTVTLPPEMGGATLPGEYVLVAEHTPAGLKLLRHVAFPARGMDR
ncbi:nuclear transport factor 2 family protein [Marinovum sp.]|uniref:nuclear transport factor 2 family protein n=1 Tax=Marinovum sp. TaxID=2024839 RepID=UPI002B2756C7|nr:nuclear transport factor 2 family protein [Marinovum sp.]